MGGIEGVVQTTNLEWAKRMEKGRVVSEVLSDLFLGRSVMAKDADAEAPPDSGALISSSDDASRILHNRFSHGEFRGRPGPEASCGPGGPPYKDRVLIAAGCDPSYAVIAALCPRM